MLDDSERRILRELQKDGRMSNVDLARKTGLSDSPCLRRVKQLEDTEIIASYTAILDHKKIGFDVVAYIQVHLDQRSEAMTRKFKEAVLNEPSITECFAMSGGYDYLIKVVAKDLDDYSDIAMKRVLRFPGVKDITSGFILDDVKTNGPLPL